MTDKSFSIFGAERRARWLITVDHASNFVPDDINGGDMGIGPQNMARHIAYDIGIRGTSLRLGELLDAPVICTNFSRLVIDPNRGLDDPTLVMQLYDGTIIPANRGVDAAEVQRRVETLYHPYHQALEKLASARDDTIVIAMHSFSPKLNGRAPRPWEIGILHAKTGQEFSLALIERLRRDSDLCVGHNHPYDGHLPGDGIDQHALQQGRLNTLIELRQDEIATEAAQHRWAARLAPILSEALTESGL